MRLSVRAKILIAILCVLAAAAAVGLIPRVTEVSVSGDQYFTADEITSQIFRGGIKDSPLVIFVRQLTGMKPKVRFLDSYRIRLTGLTSAEVTVREKTFMGYVQFLGSNMYFDRDGVILKSTRETYEGYPEVRGLDFDSAVLGQKLPVTRESLLLEVLQISQYLAAEKLEWGDEPVVLSSLVDTIVFDTAESISCRVDDIQIILGPGTNLEGKLHEMSDILPSLQGKSGTLHLESYDPVNGNAMYRFE